MFQNVGNSRGRSGFYKNKKFKQKEEKKAEGLIWILLFVWNTLQGPSESWRNWGRSRDWPVVDQRGAKSSLSLISSSPHLCRPFLGLLNVFRNIFLLQTPWRAGNLSWNNSVGLWARYSNELENHFVIMIYCRCIDWLTPLSPFLSVLELAGGPKVLWQSILELEKKPLLLYLCQRYADLSLSRGHLLQIYCQPLPRCWPRSARSSACSSCICWRLVLYNFTMLFDPDESDNNFLGEFKSARHQVPITLNRWRCTRLRFEDYKAQSGDGGNTWTVFIDQVPSIFVFFDCSGWLMDWIHVQRAGGSRKFVERKKKAFRLLIGGSNSLYRRWPSAWTRAETNGIAESIDEQTPRRLLIKVFQRLLGRSFRNKFPLLFLILIAFRPFVAALRSSSVTKEKKKPPKCSSSIIISFIFVGIFKMNFWRWIDLS